ncbi:Rep [uncultured virus]|uniref:Rep n=1 Tax=uncultured virus TaxID=340016 RepID=A0A2K9LWQ0_9VIRU|nr:Rep [uncultured virus]
MEHVEQMEKSGAGGVILEPASIKRESQYNYWFFTLNNYKVEQLEQMEQVLRHECKWYVFQEETGENGTPHLQGTICLVKKQRMSQLKRINPAIHWESTKSVKASIEYCTKYQTRTGAIHTYGITIPEDIKVAEPTGWQKQALSLLESEPDDRSIYWIWEPTGGRGKTQFCKYCVVKKDALMLTGKSADMYHMLSKFPNKRKIILVDIPRSQQDYLNYGAIEQIKNGLVFSGKYEGCQLVFNCPHVFVFANEPPDLSKMSMDRWKVYHIIDQELSS